MHDGDGPPGAARAPVAALDLFLPDADVRDRQVKRVRAPAAEVYRVARELDVQDLRWVRLVFWLRSRLMGAPPGEWDSRPFTDALQDLGWACLLERPGELFVAGAACQPWLPEVTFTPLTAGRFLDFSEPDHVKIAWTLEARPLAPALTEFATETRALATDGDARARFLRYWRWARFGIVPIRWLVLGAVRREAERMPRDGPSRSAGAR